MTTLILPHVPENTHEESILGCMYSGKSTELLRRTKRYLANGKNVLLINHTTIQELVIVLKPIAMKLKML